MVKCKANTLVRKISKKPLSREVEVDFTVIREIEACSKINTVDYVKLLPDSASAVFNRRRRPDDELNCLKRGCYNTGTLFINTVKQDVEIPSNSREGESPPGSKEHAFSGATFVSNVDAYDVFAGVVAFYVHVPRSGKYRVSTTIGDIRDVKNADVYLNDFETDAEGYYPILVNLAKLPALVSNDGWSPTELGIQMDIVVYALDEENEANAFGLSSIQLFNTIEDLEVNDVIKVACLEEVDGDYSFDTTATSCLGVQYDTADTEIEKTITGTLVTGNYQKLNPFHGRGGDTESFQIVTIEDMVKEITFGGETYGYIQTTDMFIEECGFTYATLDEHCNVTEAILTRLSSPTPIGLSEHQFIVLDGTKTTPEDLGMILFNPILIGDKVVVSYPKRVKVRHFEGRIQNKEGIAVRMSYQVQQTDNLTIRKVFPDVLVTEFPDSISNSADDTFSFTVAINPIDGDKYYDYYEIEN